MVLPHLHLIVHPQIVVLLWWYEEEEKVSLDRLVFKAEFKNAADWQTQAKTKTLATIWKWIETDICKPNEDDDFGPLQYLELTHILYNAGANEH